jgi:nucleotide-binding universal stress UspA family protein
VAEAEPSTPAFRGRADPNDSRRWTARIACKAIFLRPSSTSAPHCREERRSNVWATIGPERAARTRRARRGLAGGELATARGHNLVPGPTLLELLIRFAAARHARCQAGPARRGPRTAATTQFGGRPGRDFPAAEARPLSFAMHRLSHADHAHTRRPGKAPGCDPGDSSLSRIATAVTSGHSRSPAGESTSEPAALTLRSYHAKGAALRSCSSRSEPLLDSSSRIGPPGLARELHAAAVRGLAEDPDRPPLDLKVRLAVEEGDPVQVLAAVARGRAAALIVAGTRGRNALSAALLGSVSAGLARTAGRPVALVPASAGDEPTELATPS